MSRPGCRQAIVAAATALVDQRASIRRSPQFVVIAPRLITSLI
ncbi:hypothetical protein SAMN04488074_103114 [Lentzea albidocapillata subsp. violacea]|uniref:Uncharacterized protein n=1 Tax=Lentzea albidocapillata subsp. violacea TaxID=128104 RepID=A0A1G8WAW3_9PSEU|nr:hypothetical protein SAMN04488074_103114 [Lentzea albidocapillata subsp. violacea]